MPLRPILLAALVGIAAAPADAAPLSFGAINGAANMAGSTALTACRPAPDESRRCGLARRSFGGLEIASGEASLNADGRVQSLRILLDDRDYDTARQMLAGRYGAPAVTADRARWTGFDDGARITAARLSRATLIAFDYPANAPAPPSTGRSIWAVLAMVCLGLVLGWLAYRARRVRTAPVIQQPLSMRETLERRIREGQPLNF